MSLPVVVHVLLPGYQLAELRHRAEAAERTMAGEVRFALRQAGHKARRWVEPPLYVAGERFSFRLDADMASGLRHVARRQRVTVSDIVRIALNEHLGRPA